MWFAGVLVGRKEAEESEISRASSGVLACISFVALLQVGYRYLTYLGHASAVLGQRACSHALAGNPLLLQNWKWHWDLGISQ